MIKDPFVLELLELRGHADLQERDVEQALSERLETFGKKARHRPASSMDGGG